MPGHFGTVEKVGIPVAWMRVSVHLIVGAGLFFKPVDGSLICLRILIVCTNLSYVVHEHFELFLGEGAIVAGTEGDQFSKLVVFREEELFLDNVLDFSKSLDDVLDGSGKFRFENVGCLGVLL
jgi:hypothetical protein